MSNSHVKSFYNNDMVKLMRYGHNSDNRKRNNVETKLFELSGVINQVKSVMTSSSLTSKNVSNVEEDQPTWSKR